MPSSYSASLRFNLQATGDGENVWGAILNSGVFQLVDTAIAGWSTIALTGDLTLSSVNGTADQARSAMLKFTGTGPYTVTIPSVSKGYHVWNATSSILTISNGSASATLQAGEVVTIVTDGASSVKRVQPTDFGSARITSLADPVSAQDAATKAYADALAFTANAGILPGQVGNPGKLLGTNGTVASWRTISASDLSDYATAILGAQVALAVAL